MYSNFEGRNKINKEKLYMIIDYYNDLYNTFDMKTIPEMASELEIGESTLRLYLEKMYKEKNCDGKYSKLSLQILLCTKFVPNSPYYKAQQELNHIIKKRQIAKILKDCEKRQKVK